MELLVARQVDVADVVALDELLLSGQRISHELHRALVGCGQIELAVKGQYRVKVLLGLDVVR